MNHIGTQEIRTDRLLLRKFTMEDAAAMYHNWASDPEVTKYLMWPAHESEVVSHGILQEWTDDYRKPDCYQWAIVIPELSHEPIGTIAVVNADESTSMMHIGYCIGKKWWHQGITSEALAAVIRFLFNEVGAMRIESRHDPRNPNSGLVMKKAGMKYEGTLRMSDWNNQGVCDASYYSILKSEYKAE